jgi:hypothetical protein
MAERRTIRQQLSCKGKREEGRKEGREEGEMQLEKERAKRGSRLDRWTKLK